MDFFLSLNKLNKQTDLLKDNIIVYCFYCVLYLADPANFLASNGVLGTLVLVKHKEEVLT